MGYLAIMSYDYMPVSVIVPTFNRVALLSETLGHIFAQTMNAAEIIVVDDGSTDTTQTILSRFADRVRSIKIANSGDLVARNTGLRAASGNLVAFCDSDDLWQPDHLESMAQFWQEGRGPIAAYADFQEVRDGVWSATSKFASAPPSYWHDAEPFTPEHAVFNRPIVTRLLQFQPFFPSCMVVDRARFLAIGGWDEGVSRMVGCDFATALRIAEHPPIGVLRRPTVGIRKHAGNFSGDVQRMNLGDADVLEYVLASRPSLASFAADIRHSVIHRRLAAFDTAFARGDFAAVRAISLKLPSTALTPRHRVKAALSNLPAPIRSLAWSILTCDK